MNGDTFSGSGSIRRWEEDSDVGDFCCFVRDFWDFIILVSSTSPADDRGDLHDNAG